MKSRNFLTKVLVVILMTFSVWGLALVFSNRDALAQQKPLVIRLAHQNPESNPVAKQARFFEKLVKQRSNGNVIIEVYPAAQLFGARDIFPAVRRGAVEMAQPVTGQMQGVIPLMEIWAIPLLLQRWDQVKKAWNGYLGDILKQELEAKGVKFLAEGTYGFLNVSNSRRELRTPKDFNGLKIRTAGPMDADTIKALGASPIVMGGDEAYLAMARKTVDGSFTGLIGMSSRKYWEVQKYLTIINISYTDIPTMINLQFWKGLPIEVQKLLQECAKESEEFVLKAAIEDDDGALKDMVQNGVQVYKPTPEESKEFIKAVAPIKEAWVQKNGDIAAKAVKWCETLQ